MRDVSFEADLYRISESEMLGETLFRVLVRFTRDSDHERNWQVLAS